MVSQNDYCLIHYSTKGEEHLDSDQPTLEEAEKKDLNTWKTTGKKYSLMDSLLLSRQISVLIKLINLIFLIKDSNRILN